VEGSPGLTLTEQESLLIAYERTDRAYRPLEMAATRGSTKAADAPTAPPTRVSKQPVPQKPPMKPRPPAIRQPKPPASVPAPAPATGRAAAVVAFAKAQVGKRYAYGAAGPNTYDCSGLVMASYKKIGINLPHQSEQIAARGRKVPSGQWQPGDVIHTSGHVAIYIGGGKMVEAANPSAGVRIAPVRGGTAYRFV